MTGVSAPRPVRAELRNLAVRVLSAGILGAVVLAALRWCEPAFIAICLLGTGLATSEWVGMARRRRITFAMGMAYIALASASLIVLDHEGGWKQTLFLLLCVWATDVGAFAAGKSLGGPRLVPTISPNKTWSGAIGGVYAGAACGLLARHMGHLPGAQAATAGALISLCTQAGDMLESAAKRRFKVKDSGWIIPGHGGILDRIDGLLLAAPAYATWYLL